MQRQLFCECPKGISLEQNRSCTSTEFCIGLGNVKVPIIRSSGQSAEHTVFYSLFSTVRFACPNKFNQIARITLRALFSSKITMIHKQRPCENEDAQNNISQHGQTRLSIRSLRVPPDSKRKIAFRRETNPAEGSSKRPPGIISAGPRTSRRQTERGSFPDQ